ncbi:hypothetical protein GJ744_000555 [Endocarpon pusillum]|uniref:Uncharacterized protein n=1 Tax=Endocarpon pusillum TaxID=364733 RepID=A0A8H7E3X0_9EURO|nr:hypothetical protein GJ744_000555 [Endocarpon pusillum]
MNPQSRPAKSVGLNDSNCERSVHGLPSTQALSFTNWESYMDEARFAHEYQNLVTRLTGTEGQLRRGRVTDGKSKGKKHEAQRFHMVVERKKKPVAILIE